MISMKCFDVLNSAMIYGKPDIATDYLAIDEIVSVATRVYRWAKWQKKISVELMKRKVPPLREKKCCNRRARRSVLKSVVCTNIKTYKAINDIKTVTNDVYDKLIYQITSVQDRFQDLLKEADMIAKERGELCRVSQIDIDAKIDAYNLEAVEYAKAFINLDPRTLDGDGRSIIYALNDASLHERIDVEGKDHFRFLSLTLQRESGTYPVIFDGYKPNINKYVFMFAFKLHCEYKNRQNNSMDKRMVAAVDYFSIYYKRKKFRDYMKQIKKKQKEQIYNGFVSVCSDSNNDTSARD